MIVEPDYRAELAELRAQVRHLADELEGATPYQALRVMERLRELVGPWPHESSGT